MPGSGKYTVYEPIPPAAPGSKGSRDPRVLARTYGTPPEVANQASILAAANSALMGGPTQLQRGDPGYLPNGVDLSFSGAPNVQDDVKTGGGGLPMTPWSPNVASPGEGNGADPSKQPDMTATGAIPNPKAPGLNKSAQPGVDGLEDPKLDSSKMAPKNPLSTNAAALPKGADPGRSPPKFV